jgi:hypothetical protein
MCNHRLNAMRLAICLLGIITLRSHAVAQNAHVALPRVTAAAVPLYPSLARYANVSGTVHVKITTNGERVLIAKALDGPKILRDAAVDNALTWRFSLHDPTTFTLTYAYIFDPELKLDDPESPEVVLRLPTRVEVRMLPYGRHGDPGL